MSDFNSEMPKWYAITNSLSILESVVMGGWDAFKNLGMMTKIFDVVQIIYGFITPSLGGMSGLAIGGLLLLTLFANWPKSKPATAAPAKAAASALYDVDMVPLINDLNSDNELNKLVSSAIKAIPGSEKTLDSDKIEKALESITVTNESLYSHLTADQKKTLESDSQAKALITQIDQITATGITPPPYMADMIKALNQKIVLLVYGNAVKIHTEKAPPLPKKTVSVLSSSPNVTLVSPAFNASGVVAKVLDSKKKTIVLGSQSPDKSFADITLDNALLDASHDVLTLNVK